MFMAQQSLLSQGLLITEASRSQTHARAVGLLGLVISPTQRPLPCKIFIFVISE